MGFGEAIRSGFNHYVDFNGRAPRAAYWWWFLFTVLVGIAANILDALVGTGAIVGANAAGRPVSTGVIAGLASLVLLLPSLTVAVRRLHDADRSAWWLLIAIIPIIGWLVLLFFYVQEGTPGANRFGPPPTERTPVPTIS